MDLRLVRCSYYILAAWIGGFVFLGSGFRCTAQEAVPSAIEEIAAERARRVVRSAHFLLHTDLSAVEARELLDGLEIMLRKISAYWGRPARGAIECYVVRNLDAFPRTAMAPIGIREVRTAGGVTLMHYDPAGKRRQPVSTVYACDRPEVVRHEVIHAYCHQTFGNIGPIWYSEGMAELGRYWADEDESPVVRADRREIEHLRANPPKSLAEILSSSQTTGDGWQNYASRWALCHFLATNPNYCRQFSQLGRGFLAGKDVVFEQTFGVSNRQLFFEYLFFLQHIESGYRVDLCAWDWKTSFSLLRPGHEQRVPIAAGRGWQPTGISAASGTRYEFTAEGCWQVGGNPVAVNADGCKDGRGRLVAVLMKDGRLGEEWELGAKGSFQLSDDGDLYLRCRNAWNELSGDSGRIAVTFKRSSENDM